MAGAIWADMIKDGRYIKFVDGRLILIKKAMMNKRRNLNPRLSYLKPTIYAKSATRI